MKKTENAAQACPATHNQFVTVILALVMALDRAQRNLNGGSVYDERGLLTLDW